MAALAVSAGSRLAAARWATADRPAPCGLLHVHGGIGNVHAAPGIRVPVDGLLWGPHPDGLSVLAYVTRDRLRAHLDAHGIPDRLGLGDGQVTDPLIFVGGQVLPVTADPVPLPVTADPDMCTVLSTLAAAWLLMQQPALVDRTTQQPDKATHRAYTRAGRPDPDVTIVDLRHQYIPQDQDPGAEQAGSRYRHRWVVSGHWRNQPYGPGRSLRRQTWVPAYVKGPEGAPLLATERVNVWRR